MLASSPASLRLQTWTHLVSPWRACACACACAPVPLGAQQVRQSRQTNGVGRALVRVAFARLWAHASRKRVREFMHRSECAHVSGPHPGPPKPPASDPFSRTNCPTTPDCPFAPSLNWTSETMEHSSRTWPQLVHTLECPSESISLELHLGHTLDDIGPGSETSSAHWHEDSSIFSRVSKSVQFFF